MKIFKKVKIAHIGYLYRGLLIERKSSWETLSSNWAVKDVRHRAFLFTDYVESDFIKKPMSISSGSNTIKEAMEEIDQSLDIEELKEV
jgi:hypothetical protein